MAEVVYTTSRNGAAFCSAAHYTGAPNCSPVVRGPNGASRPSPGPMGKPMKADGKNPMSHQGVGDTFQNQRAKARRGVR